VKWGDRYLKPGVKWGDLGCKWGEMGWNARRGRGVRIADIERDRKGKIYHGDAEARRTAKIG